MIKLLIIEDDVQLNTALKIYFEKTQYLVFQAFNCKEARQMIKREPDIIIVDVGLPDGSGIDLCRHMLADKKIPVIFLTARDEEKDILEGYEAGCEEYVTKPVSPKVLLNILRLHLSLKMMLEDYKKLCDIAVYCGFYDQSHFIKEMKRYIGISPLQLLDHQ